MGGFGGEGCERKCGGWGGPKGRKIYFGKGIHTQGSGNHVAPKLAMYVNKPTAAPLAAASVPGMRQLKTSTILNPWPTVPQRKSLRLPARSMMNQLTVAKME